MVLCEKCKEEAAEKVLKKDDPKAATEWDITCSDCGEDSTVPFEPRDGWPVYCRKCYAKRQA